MCTPLAAHAWGSLLLIDAPPAANSLAIGPSLWTLPTYPGARHARGLLLPGVDYYAASGFFASTDTAVGWNFAPRAKLQAGVRIWPQPGRSAHDSPSGIEPVATRWQLQAFANYQLWPALLLQTGVLRGSSRHHDGAQFEAGFTTGLPVGEDLLGIGLAASYANRAHEQSYYGVSSAESAASGLPAYAPAGGRQDMSLTLSGEHRIAKAWRVDAQLVLARLSGTVASSPLVQSRQQRAATLTVWREL